MSRIRLCTIAPAGPRYTRYGKKKQRCRNLYGGERICACDLAMEYKGGKLVVVLVPVITLSNVPEM